MNVNWRPSPNFSAAPGRRVVGVVLHDTEGDLASALATFSRAGGVSAHYVLDADGTCYQCVAEDNVAYHVAAFGNDPSLNRNRPNWLPPYNGLYSAVNACTIGIELVGRASQGYTAAQYAALGELLPLISVRSHFAIRLLPDAGPGATVVTHGWLQTDRSDPGLLFDWQQLRNALTQEANVTDQERQQLQGEIDQLNGVNTELQRQVDGVREQLADANSTIGALEHDVIPALQAAAQSDQAATVADLQARLQAIAQIVNATVAPAGS